MINIIYEDNHILVVEKPINMPVQEDESKDIDLLSTIKKYVKEKYNKPGNVYIGLVHRLDRPVGGIMVFAKTSKAANRLSTQIQNHQIKKIYYAVVVGNPKPNKGTFIDKLLKDQKGNITKINEKGKEAILNYEVINTKGNMSLVKIDLQTGRSHQIRVQFSSRNYPLYGDQKYNKNTKKTQIALFAHQIEFTHPTTKENMIFKIDLPNKYPYNIFN